MPKQSKVQCKSDRGLAGDLRMIPQGNSFIIELTYQKKEEKEPVLLDRDEGAFIDLGVNNFAAIVTTKSGEKPILVKSGFLTSINQSYNKRAAELRSKGYKKHLESVTFKRQRRIDDAIHKISRGIVDYCAAQDIGRIFTGRNKNWKQSTQMGRRNNQNFVNIPHAKLIEQLRYKGEAFGIEVVEVMEDYTAKASAVDYDPIPEYEAGKKRGPFSGKRILRGLYRTKDGKLLGLDEGVFVNTPTVIRTLYGERKPLEFGVRPKEAAAVSLR